MCAEKRFDRLCDELCVKAGLRQLAAGQAVGQLGEKQIRPAAAALLRGLGFPAGEGQVARDAAEKGAQAVWPRKTNNYEMWKKMLTDPDWAKYER